MINSDTMLRSLAPTQLRPMTYHLKKMWGCDVCNTSKNSQELMNAWWHKKSKIIKDKAKNSPGRGKHELSKSFKSYDDYTILNDETCHPRCENAADSVLCSLSKCTACTSSSLLTCYCCN